MNLCQLLVIPSKMFFCQNNKHHILPDIKGIQSIECLSNGTIQDVQKGTAKYVIQMRITYYRDYNDYNNDDIISL